MKEDCYFYFMVNRIPCCCLFDNYALGVYRCNKCTDYISRSEVYKLVKSEVLSRREKSENKSKELYELKADGERREE